MAILMVKSNAQEPHYFFLIASIHIFYEFPLALRRNLWLILRLSCPMV